MIKADGSLTRWKAVRAFSETPRFWRFETADGISLLIPRAGLTPADDAAVAAAMKSFAGRVGGADLP
ncbi:YcxB family protein [Rhizocola hellebori]|uniref:YcxB family protein n=1 Tax=Rhizocola hellebori TaxID=1392758 RepID=UPI00357118C9